MNKDMLITAALTATITLVSFYILRSQLLSP